SDPNLNFHFTPIGKGNTYPESLDIVVVTGPQPGNLPPVSSPSANILNPSSGQAVTFSANAFDPNGDTLAYYWEFGDGSESYSADNKPTQVHSFAAGEYAVRCVVSDMRGGTAQHTLIVRVGNPSLFSISGHVTDHRSQPMAGALVRTGSRSVFTDSDGSYVIPGLGAGNYTVSAIEPLRGAVELIHPFFNNPVTVGPSAQHIDFIGGTSAPPVTLVAAGAVWKYLDKGTDEGTAWQAPLFNDLTWSNGPAQLGYNEGDEATRIEDNATPGYNGPDTDRYITYYFRHSFNVANPATLTNLVLNVLRDDGAIVYLNGVEIRDLDGMIIRSNMPSGAINSATVASSNIPDTAEGSWLEYALDPTLLVEGQNVIAVEIHQSTNTSSDIS
ncbi:MAG TPA: PKD domain-containing protein, partial [Burkholderiaceae bacterium]|nr:PKD domain-containing protein [Burkholderiaceae bacterium]